MGNPLEEFDENSDSFTTKGNQINNKGNSDMLYNLGKLFIAMSKYETDDLNYHVHINDVKRPINNDFCEIIIHKF